MKLDRARMVERTRDNPIQVPIKGIIGSCAQENGYHKGGTKVWLCTWFVHPAT